MASTASTTSNDQAKERERLREHFQGTEPKDHASKWNELWIENYLPWDRQGPSIALGDAITEHKQLFGAPTIDTSGDSKTRRRALVPGCGKGYDVLYLASFGYDAIGLDASEVAVGKAREIQKEHEGKGAYATKDEDAGSGSSQFMVQDFFSEDLVDSLGKFDIIYDYTFLCALPPARRPAWALQISKLLLPEGKLVCLEFPSSKPPKTGGPPWGVYPELYQQLLKRPGEDVSYNEEGYVTPEDVKENEHALERLAHWRAKRTHASGQGTDHVGIWRHKR